MTQSIALITELFRPSVGGQEYRFEQFAHGLAHKGCRVDVFTLDYTEGELPAEERMDGFTVIRHAKIPRYIRSGSRSLTGLVRYSRAVSELTADIHSEYDAMLINEMPLVHLLTIRPTSGMLVDWCEFPTEFRGQLLAIWAARRFHRGLTVDEPLSDRLRNVNPSMVLRVVRSPVDLNGESNALRDPDLILFLGRIVAHKNLDALLEGVVRLNQETGLHKRVVVVGDGPLRVGLEKRYASYPFIEFRGRVSDAAKLDLLHRAWLVALPSKREGFPNAFAEAIAAGTPVLAVTSRLNGAGSFIERHKVGVVASGASPRRIASAISRLSGEDWSSFEQNTKSVRRLFDRGSNLDYLLGMMNGKRALT
ncbi:MAG: glycosyltransferase family 4 protein [Thermoplasmata archaeon]